MRGAGVKWYEDRIRKITTVAPERAHALAAAQCAGLAARAIGGSGTGTLARDVSRPKTVGFMHRQVGSELPYAAIENFGGTIRAKGGGRMLIRGKRGGGRSSTGGPIVASATEVHHVGKGYLTVAERAFPLLFISSLKRMLKG